MIDSKADNNYFVDTQELTLIKNTIVKKATNEHNHKQRVECTFGVR